MWEVGGWVYIKEWRKSRARKRVHTYHRDQIALKRFYRRLDSQLKRTHGGKRKAISADGHATPGNGDLGKSVIPRGNPPKAVRKNIQGSLRRISNTIPGFSDNGSSSHALLFGWKLEDNTACNSGRTLSLNPQPILRVVDSCENFKFGLVAFDGR